MEKDRPRPKSSLGDSALGELDFIDIEHNQRSSAPPAQILQPQEPSRGRLVDYVESAPAPSRAPEARAKPYLDARKIEERFQMVADQLNEISRIMALRTERLAVKIKLLEERQANFIEDFQKRLTSLTTKALSGARVDVKVAELIEKHNQVVRTFENRLSQLKRVVENQEIELYKAANELQEARKELAKLKRG